MIYIYEYGQGHVGHRVTGEIETTTGWLVFNYVRKQSITEEMRMNIRDEHFNRTHLPVSNSLDRYGDENWILIGTLTAAKPLSPPALLDRFRTLMDTLGGANHCHGKRLHWFVRVEGGADKRHHLHCLVGKQRVEDGHYHPFSATEACSFVSRNWTFGKTKVRPYDEAKDGVGYVTKLENRASRDDYYEISKSLLKTLNKDTPVVAAPKAIGQRYADRDPLSVAIITAIRERGGLAWFGDEVPNWEGRQ